MCAASLSQDGYLLTSKPVQAKERGFHYAVWKGLQPLSSFGEHALHA